MVQPVGVDAGATAWVLVSTALVSLMTPGLALFYGGMVPARNVLTMLMQGLATMALVGVVWVLVGHSLAFGGDNPFIGDFSMVGMVDIDRPVPGLEDIGIPPVVFAGFQLMFAIVTAALIIGAPADRWKFGAFVPFMILWPILVYAPVAHWIFAPSGWAAQTGALDFAGGTVVHVNAGAAALAMALVVGRRRGWPDISTRPHNLPFVLLGAALLWFGWFGFNAGSALAAGKVAGYALVNTHTAAAAALLAWAAVERLRFGKATTLGAASGVVCGLVAITPAAGYVAPLDALVIGLVAGGLCALAVSLKSWFGYDDALDVVGVHLVAGAIGSVAVGLFARASVNPDGADGLFAGGQYSLLGVQVLTVLAVAAYSFVVTFLLGSLLDRIVGNRVSSRVEQVGLDLALHGESAYDSGLPAAPIAAPGPPPPSRPPRGGPMNGPAVPGAPTFGAPTFGAPMPGSASPRPPMSGGPPPTSAPGPRPRPARGGEGVR